MYLGLGLVWLAKAYCVACQKAQTLSLMIWMLVKGRKEWEQSSSLLKYLLAQKKKPVALYDSMIYKSSRHVWDQRWALRHPPSLPLPPTLPRRHTNTHNHHLRKAAQWLMASLLSWVVCMPQRNKNWNGWNALIKVPLLNSIFHQLQDKWAYDSLSEMNKRRNDTQG